MGEVCLRRTKKRIKNASRVQHRGSTPILRQAEVFVGADLEIAVRKFQIFTLRFPSRVVTRLF